jgi:hypothetical protein
MKPFYQFGQTVTFTAGTSAPTPVQTSNVQQVDTNDQQYRIINSGSQVVYLGVGNTSALATSNATVISTTGNAIPLLPGTDEILSFTKNSYFTGITSTGTAQIFITPGSGS